MSQERPKYSARRGAWRLIIRTLKEAEEPRERAVEQAIAQEGWPRTGGRVDKTLRAYDEEIDRIVKRLQESLAKPQVPKPASALPAAPEIPPGGA